MDLRLAAIDGSYRQRCREDHSKQRASQAVEIRHASCLIGNKEKLAVSICIMGDKPGVGGWAG